MRGTARQTPPEDCTKEPRTLVALVITAERWGGRVWGVRLARLARCAIWAWLGSGFKWTDMCHRAFFSSGKNEILIRAHAKRSS